jgi:hypothetical protein
VLLQLGINYDFQGISRKQVSVALSTTKMEYITTNVASHEAVWLQNFLHDFLIRTNITSSRHDAEGSSEASTHIHR